MNKILFYFLFLIHLSSWSWAQEAQAKFSCNGRYEDEALGKEVWKPLVRVEPEDPDYYEAKIENYYYSADTSAIEDHQQISMMIMDANTKRHSTFTASMFPIDDHSWYADLNYYDIKPSGGNLILNLVCLLNFQ